MLADAAMPTLPLSACCPHLQRRQCCCAAVKWLGSCICKIAHMPLAWPALWPQQCAPVPPVAPPSPSPSSVVALSLSRLPFPLQQTHVSGDSGTAKVEAGIVAAAAAPTAVQRYSDGNHSSVEVCLAAGAERLRVQACSIPAAGTAVIGGSGVVQA